MSIFFNFNNPDSLLGQSSCPFSIDPSIPSLKELLFYEMKQICYYAVKLSEIEADIKVYRDRVIYLISIIGAHIDFKRNEIHKLITEIKEIKENIEKYYLEECKTKNINAQPLKPYYDLQTGFSELSTAIHEGERQCLFRNKILSQNKKYLYEIIINLVENSCLYLTEIDNYDIDEVDIKMSVIKLLNITNFPSMADEKWLSKVMEFSKLSFLLIEKLKDIILQTFGHLIKKEVSIRTKIGPAILVCGHHFKDLESILNATLNEEVNVYTHNGMVLAHTSPLTDKYPHLVGHFQKSTADTLIDFESFPGPILITRNSQISKNLIRGRIYTIDEYFSFGTSKIPDGDYSEIIQAAKESPGFKKEAEYGKITVGFDEEEILDKLHEIFEGIKSGKIKRVILIDLLKHYPYKNPYLEKLFDIIPDDYFVISLSYPSQKNNIWHIDSYYGYSVACKILSEFEKNFDISKLNFTAILTQCSIQTVTHILDFKNLGINSIYLGTCCPLIMSPTMKEGLKELFGVKYLGQDPEVDFKDILDETTN